MASDQTVLALDVGERRIGVAIAHQVARLPRPLTTLATSLNVQDEIVQLVEQHQASHVVVGLPRNLSGDDTDQTRKVREFATQLAPRLAVPVSLQDEALTSQKAEAELISKGKPYAKGDIDALAATYILEDYLQAQPPQVVA